MSELIHSLMIINETHKFCSVIFIPNSFSPNSAIDRARKLVNMEITDDEEKEMNFVSTLLSTRNLLLIPGKSIELCKDDLEYHEIVLYIQESEKILCLSSVNNDSGILKINADGRF